MSTHTSLILILLGILSADTTEVRISSRTFSGWSPLAQKVNPDSLVQGPYRTETYFPNGSIRTIDFFDLEFQFVKRHEFYYDREGNLFQQRIMNRDHEIMGYYLYTYDHIVMDWKMVKYSPRGEWLNAMYLQELVYDTARIDPSFFHGVPIQFPDSLFIEP